MNIALLARAAGWPLLALAVFLTLAPPTFRPVTGIGRHLEHLLVFSLLGLLFGSGYPRSRVGATLIGIMITALLETLQLWAPGRHAYFSDFLTNTIGLCAGFAASALLQRTCSNRRDA